MRSKSAFKQQIHQIGKMLKLLLVQKLSSTDFYKDFVLDSTFDTKRSLFAH